MPFFQWKQSYVGYNFTQFSIVACNGLAPNRQRATNGIYYDPNHWRIYASIGLRQSTCQRAVTYTQNMGCDYSSMPWLQWSLAKPPSHDDVIKWKHFTRYWSLVRGIHPSRVDSPHEGQWRRALFFFDLRWTNGWANDWDAGDLTARQCLLWILRRK